MAKRKKDKKTNNDQLLMLASVHHLRTWRQQNESTITFHKVIYNAKAY